MKATRYKLVEMKDQGYVDVNTGLFSSRFFKTIIAKQVQAFERYQTCFSLLLITIDERAIKEAHAHVKEIGDFIRSNVRVIDEIGSSGEGQFCVLLPHTPPEGAAVVAARIERGLIEKLERDGEGVLLELLSPTGDLEHIRELADLA